MSTSSPPKPSQKSSKTATVNLLQMAKLTVKTPWQRSNDKHVHHRALSQPAPDPKAATSSLKSLPWPRTLTPLILTTTYEIHDDLHELRVRFSIFFYTGVRGPALSALSKKNKNNHLQKSMRPALLQTSRLCKICLATTRHHFLSIFLRPTPFCLWYEALLVHISALLLTASRFTAFYFLLFFWRQQMVEAERR